MANKLKVQEREAIGNLSRLGWGIRRIARELGLSRNTVRGYVRDLNGTVPAVLAEEIVKRAAISLAGSPVHTDPLSTAGNTETFLRALESAFRAFGGSTLTVNLDNLKAAVLKADWADPELNPKLVDFARHDGTTINLAKIYTCGLDLIAQREVSSGLRTFYGHDGNGNTRYLATTNVTVPERSRACERTSSVMS